MYYSGWGVEKDVEKARYWWEKAAARGSLVALQSLELLGRK
jgi:TPR repeat protein